LEEHFGTSLNDVLFLGPLVSMLEMSRFTRVTAILIKSGVPILQILDLVAVSLKNSIIAQEIQKLRRVSGRGRECLNQ